MFGFSELSVKVSEDRGEERGVIEEELPGRQRNSEEDEQVSSSVVQVMITVFDRILQVCV
jgi:hypothetical protein